MYVFGYQYLLNLPHVPDNVLSYAFSLLKKVYLISMSENKLLEKKKRIHKQIISDSKLFIINFISVH